MNYEIRHDTHYRYSDAVTSSHHLARLTLRETPRQRCLEHSLRIDPRPSVQQERRDAFGNAATFFALQSPHSHLLVEVRHRVETAAAPPFDPAGSPPWEEWRDALARDESGRLIDPQTFLFASPCVPVTAELAAYAAPSFPPGMPLLQGVLDLTDRIHEDFVFDPLATTVSTPVEEILKSRRGVCQDFAHLQIACLRSLGLAARYVSGYLETVPPPGKEKLIGSDASHAWLAVFCPQNGWVEVDPTNNCVAGERHIILAWGRDFSDVSPIRGVIYGSGSHVLKVSVDVVPVTPRTV